MIVVDASTLIDALTGAEGSPGLQRRLLQAQGSLNVPAVTDLEVVQGLRRLVLRSALAPDRAKAALEGYRDLPLRRYPHLPFLDRIWALRHNITAYDAAYVALAEWLDVPLLTRDARLANAGGHAARIEVV